MLKALCQYHYLMIWEKGVEMLLGTLPSFVRHLSPILKPYHFLYSLAFSGLNGKIVSDV